MRDWQRLIDEHLGLSGPKPSLPAKWLASELREIAEQRAEHSATDAFVLEEAAARLAKLADREGMVRAALAGLVNWLDMPTQGGRNG